MTAAGNARLERLAIEVPDLDAWADAFERILGPGFQRHRVRQATGEVDIAIHPGGVELVAGAPGSSPHLRSFHLAAPDLSAALTMAKQLGWRKLDRVVLEGRRHEIFDAAGLRVIFVGPGRVEEPS